MNLYLNVRKICTHNSLRLIDEIELLAFMSTPSALFNFFVTPHKNLNKPFWTIFFDLYFLTTALSINQVEGLSISKVYFPGNQFHFFIKKKKKPDNQRCYLWDNSLKFIAHSPVSNLIDKNLAFLVQNMVLLVRNLKGEELHVI